MKEVPQKVSDSVRKLNPHIYGGGLAGMLSSAPDKFPHNAGDCVRPTPKRIRQSTKPLMNKLEQAAYDYLSTDGDKVIPQGITFRLANGLRYTPDLFCFEWDARPIAFEVKGSWFTDDANAKLKMFATTYPQITVYLMWKTTTDSGWQFQEVLR